MGEKRVDIGAVVAAAILENGHIGHAVIEVEDDHGQIILRGNTATEQEKRAAEHIAATQQGVTKVINEIIYG